MEVLYPRCAGLDVHKETVVACVRRAEGGEITRQHRTFDTSTCGLLALSQWLTGHACTHVALEATGVYWKPVWHILEGAFALILANAMHIKNVPGRKTDVSDAAWIADLLAHGLIRPSFVPDRPIQEVRALTRTRKQLVREKAAHVQRIHKTLEDANLKLGSAASDIMGLSGRALLHALIAGESDPERLADLTRGRLKASRASLVEALRGTVTKNHRFLLQLHLDQIAGLDAAIGSLDAELDSLLAPVRPVITRLTTIPGVSDVVAQVLVAEAGTDMARFPTVGHLISWAGLCPRNDESAGKRRSTRLRKGAPWLKTALVQAAWCATRAKPNYLRSQFLRLKSRRGPKKAVVAVAASILTAAYFIIRDGVDYRDLGADHFDRLDKNTKVRRLLRQLTELGYDVTNLRRAG
jgi:transposase